MDIASRSAGASLLSRLGLTNRTIERNGLRWPQLVSVGECDDFDVSSGLLMTKYEKFQCLLIGSYYLSHNISSKNKDGNLNQFLKNLESFMENSETKEDYTTDSDGMHTVHCCNLYFVVVAV